MQPSRRDSNSERKRELNQEPIILQPEPKQLEELGEGRRRNDSNTSRPGSGNETAQEFIEEEEVTIREASTIDRPDSAVN